MTVLQRIFCSSLVLAFLTGPAFALDYEAKPINWCIKAPVKLLGGMTGAVVNGLVCGPIDDGYHWSLKGTKHVAGKFGDENGTGQLACAAPIGGSVGLVLGSAYGVLDGTMHGFKAGWDKPFSHGSYVMVTEEEKKK